MPVDPELIGLLAVAEAKIEAVLGHPDLKGINWRAVNGVKNTLRHARTRLIKADEPPEPRQPWGIERSLPQGDR
jgi:hypothetical protein